MGKQRFIRILVYTAFFFSPIVGNFFFVIWLVAAAIIMVNV